MTLHLTMNELLGGLLPDISGNGNHGTLTDVSFVPGKPGLRQAASFNGSSSKIQVADSPGLRLTNVGSLLCWFQRSETSTINAKLIIKAINSSAASKVSYQLYLNSSYPRLYLSNGTTTISITWSSRVSDTNWHHLASVWDGLYLNLYLDGVAATPVSQTIDAQASASHDLWLGENGTLGNQHLPGLLDDVRIYDEALPAWKIKAIYNFDKGSEECEPWQRLIQPTIQRVIQPLIAA